MKPQQSTCHQGKNGSGTWVAAANMNMDRVMKEAAHLLQEIIDLYPLLKCCQHVQKHIFIYITYLIKSVLEKKLKS